jgi:hypothetical protein
VLVEPDALPDVHMLARLIYMHLHNSPVTTIDATHPDQVFIMSKDPEEATKEAARKAVTEGLTDPDTIRLLSAAGDAAKRSRPNSPLPRSRPKQVHAISWTKSRFYGLT